MPKIECDEVQTVALRFALDNDEMLAKKQRIIERRLNEVKQRRNVAKVAGMGSVLRAHGYKLPPSAPELVFNDKGNAVLTWPDEKKAGIAPEEVHESKVLEGAANGV